MDQGIKVLAFAGARDVIGTGELWVNWPGPDATASDLLDIICEQFPGLQAFRPVLRVAINGNYASTSQNVAPGDEVALIPPVAGG